jgi:hypothetical protein
MQPSDEMVELLRRVAKIMPDAFGKGAVSGPDADEFIRGLHAAADALTAAMGEEKPVAWQRQPATEAFYVGLTVKPAYRYQTPDTRSFSQTTPPMTPDRNAIERSFSVTRPSREDVVEECAKVADEYTRRMTEAIPRNAAKGYSTAIPECKADAGESIATAIRKLKERS